MFWFTYEAFSKTKTHCEMESVWITLLLLLLCSLIMFRSISSRADDDTWKNKTEMKCPLVVKINRRNSSWPVGHKQSTFK